MGNPLLQKNYSASAAVAANRIVARTATDGTSAQAAAATDKLHGVCAEVGPAAGERFDVVEFGLADVQFGGNVVAGDELTSDANGMAIAVTPPRIHQAGIAGGAAGAHTVTGIATTDSLISVKALDVTDATKSLTDITAQCTISAANTIDNTGGTNTTGLFLFVTYRNQDVHIVGVAENSGALDEIGVCRVEPRILRA